MKIFLYFLMIVLNLNSFAQQKGGEENQKRTFEEARELAFKGKRQQSQEVLQLLLEENPYDVQARTLLAKTYSWDGEYDLARDEFKQLIKYAPREFEVWEAAIKNEFYSNSPFKALEMADRALKHLPNNDKILFLKAKAEAELKNNKEALATLEPVLEKDPDNEEALALKASILRDLRKNDIIVRSYVDIYSKVFDPMQYYSVGWRRKTKLGSITAKVNMSHRFQTTGTQYEVDMYPKITKGMYGYLNFGVSNSSLYPDVRYGAELYKSLPLSLDASLGVRVLKYNTTTTVYTGSLGWYTGNDYLQFRAYLTPNDRGTSKSGFFTYRKYRKNAYNYFGVEIGMGFSPEIYQFQSQGNEETIINLKSQKLRLEYYFSSKNNKNRWGLQTGVAHQEMIFNPGSYFWVYNVGLTWYLSFR